MFSDQPPADYTSIPNQQLNARLPTQFLPLFADYSLYSWYGFAYMQNWAANSILKRLTTNVAQIAVMTVPMPTRPLVQDEFQFLLRISLTSVLFLIYIPPLYRTVYRIVSEKESRAKETMLMMGLSRTSYWLSWFAYFSCV